MTRTMHADAPMMIGWSKGIALQLSLPRRFIFLPSVTSDKLTAHGIVRTAFRRSGCC